MRDNDAVREEGRLVPTRFRIVGSERADGHIWDTVESREVPGQPPKWVAMCGGFVATNAKAGGWAWEPIPSSRTEAFKKRTRFVSPEEALAAYDRAIANDARRVLPPSPEASAPAQSEE